MQFQPAAALSLCPRKSAARTRRAARSAASTLVSRRVASSLTLRRAVELQAGLESVHRCEIGVSPGHRRGPDLVTPVRPQLEHPQPLLALLSRGEALARGPRRPDPPGDLLPGVLGALPVLRDLARRRVGGAGPGPRRSDGARRPTPGRTRRRRIASASSGCRSSTSWPPVGCSSRRSASWCSPAVSSAGASVVTSLSRPSANGRSATPSARAIRHAGSSRPSSRRSSRSARTSGSGWSSPAWAASCSVNSG